MQNIEPGMSSALDEGQLLSSPHVYSPALTQDTRGRAWATGSRVRQG